MSEQFDSKVVGAFIVGFAIVAGAYVLSNMRTLPQASPQEQMVASAVGDSHRNFIEVTDSDGDGVEDWQDQFLKSVPVVIESTTKEYVPPTTLSGRVGVSYFQNSLSSKIYAPFGKTQDEILKETLSGIVTEASDKMYGLKDIKISDDTSGPAIKNYANSMALSIINNPSDTDNELFLLQKIVQDNNSPKAKQDLQKRVDGYKKIKEEFIATPVPRIFVKEHLDFINVMNAIQNDIAAMLEINDDPLLTLIRLKRYEDDAFGLKFATENMYKALEPHAGHFTVDDPAVLFVAFGPDFNQ